MMDISVSLQKIGTKFLKMYHYRPNIQDTSIFMFPLISIPGSCRIWKDTDLQLVTHAEPQGHLVSSDELRKPGGTARHPKS